ncbi:MAG TPA: hypoxanthine phosphoribosyltransferase [Eubacteriales bacterium]|nr:hypoxanthine phosphoribosyltransferase [Clostridia bacterium]HRV73205.1 hypoxanthine phosphoribosyltransferase [Eubacteriales bacterium]
MAQDIAEVLLSEEVIRARVKELGEQLSRDYAGKEVVLVCILKGACVFFADLARQMTVHIKMDFMGISSYGDAMKTSGIVRITKDMDTSITDRHVIIAEDIMDSGLTLSHLTRLLSARNPASMRICCLLDKPERRECDITPDYCGFLIPNKFVVGYGLDYEGRYRNLPYVGVLKPEVYSDR